MNEKKRIGDFKRVVSPHTRNLRANMTDAEEKLWFRLRDRRLNDYKFRRQVTIHPFVADFLCVQKKLIVEADGSQHNEDTDAKRTAFLEAQGYRIVRFWNEDILRDTESVLATILAALQQE